MWRDQLRKVWWLLAGLAVVTLLIGVSVVRDGYRPIVGGYFLLLAGGIVAQDIMNWHYASAVDRRSAALGAVTVEWDAQALHLTTKDHRTTVEWSKLFRVVEDSRCFAFYATKRSLYVIIPKSALGPEGARRVRSVLSGRVPDFRSYAW